MIPALLTSMLQTILGPLNISFSSTKANKSQYNQKVKDVSDASGMVKTLSKAKKSKKLVKSKKPELAKTINKIFRTDFLILEVKMAFLHLQIAFIEIPILYCFDTEIHIRIKTDAFRYAINGILSQLILDQNFSNYVIGENLNFFKSSQWHPLVFFSRKMIFVKTWYEIYN